MDLKEVLKRGVCIRLESHYASGRKKLRRSDLKDVEAAQIPPSELASLGSKWILDKKEIQAFRTPVERAERLCATKGVRFMDVLYLVDVKVFTEIDKEIDCCIDEFKAVRADFASRIDSIQEAWRKANPDWKHIIDDNPLTSEDVERRFSFRKHHFRIAPPDGEISDGLKHAIGGLAGTLFAEIADTAHDIIKESFEGREKVSRRALRGIKACAEKLETLDFIDPRTRPVAQRIRATLNAIPKEGPIAGSDLDGILGLLFILSDVKRVMWYGETAGTGGTQEETVEQQTLVLPDPVVISTPSPAPRMSGFYI